MMSILTEVNKYVRAGGGCGAACDAANAIRREIEEELLRKRPSLARFENRKRRMDLVEKKFAALELFFQHLRDIDQTLGRNNLYSIENVDGYGAVRKADPIPSKDYYSLDAET